MPDHILTPFCHQLQPVLIFLICQSRQETLAGDPARTAGKDIEVVDAKVERLAVVVFFLNQLSASKSDFLGD